MLLFRRCHQTSFNDETVEIHKTDENICRDIFNRYRGSVTH